MAYDEATQSAHAGHGCSADPTKIAREPENGESTAPDKPRDLTASELIESALHAEAIAASLREQAVQMQIAAEIARRPKMPDCSEGARYVTWSKYQSGREYAFAAVGWVVPASRGHMRAERTYWAVTGEESGRHNWAALLKIIGEENWSTLHVVETQTRIGPDPQDEPPVSMSMGSFGVVRGVRVGARLPGYQYGER